MTTKFIVEVDDEEAYAELLAILRASHANRDGKMFWSIPVDNASGRAEFEDGDS